MRSAILFIVHFFFITNYFFPFYSFYKYDFVLFFLFFISSFINYAFYIILVFSYIVTYFQHIRIKNKQGGNAFHRFFYDRLNMYRKHEV